MDVILFRLPVLEIGRHSSDPNASLWSKGDDERRYWKARRPACHAGRIENTLQEQLERVGIHTAQT